MDDFVNELNQLWTQADPVALAAYALWRLNWIHPFINGNGRTARVVAYYIICLKVGKALPGTTILPELIRINRLEYVAALQEADAAAKAGLPNISKLQALLDRLLSEQLKSVAPEVEMDEPSKAAAISSAPVVSHESICRPAGKIEKPPQRAV